MILCRKPVHELVIKIKIVESLEFRTKTYNSSSRNLERPGYRSKALPSVLLSKVNLLRNEDLHILGEYCLASPRCQMAHSRRTLCRFLSQEPVEATHSWDLNHLWCRKPLRSISSKYSEIEIIKNLFYFWLLFELMFRPPL